MKRIKKIVVLVLAVAMTAGVLTGCSFSIGGKALTGNSSNKNAGNYTSCDAEITEKIESIDIEWQNGSVTVVKGTGNSIKISEECRTELDDTHKMQWWIDGKKLKIKFDSSFGLILFNMMPDKHLTVTIPEGMEFKEFNISSASGDVSVDETVSKYVNISAASGTIDINKMTGDEVYLDSASGDITIGQLAATRVEMNSASGNIETGEIIADDVEMDLASGRVKANKITANTIDIDSASGDIKINEADCNRAIFDSASGEVEVKFTKVPNSALVDTASGDITLTLPKDAEFTAEVDTLSGNLHCDFPCSFGDDKLVVGSGTATISIDSASGNVNIYQEEEACQKHRVKF